MRNKGFTLIELLAVIIILAVIALITVPAVMSVVSDAKQSAFKDSAYGLIKTADAEYVQDTFEDSTIDKFFLFTNGVMTSYPSGSTLDYKGSTPLDGGLVLHSDGTVTVAIHDGTYCATKTRYVSEVTVSTMTKANCNNEIFYSQASAPFSNLIINGNFNNGTNGWLTGTAITNVVDGKLVSKSTEIHGGATQNIANYSDYKTHKMYFTCMVKSDTASLYVAFNDGVSQTLIGYADVNNFQKLSSIGLVDNNATDLFFKVQDQRDSEWTEIYFDDVITLDLTSTFGAGNEPTIAQMDHNLNKVWIDTANGNIPKRFTAGGWASF